MYCTIMSVYTSEANTVSSAGLFLIVLLPADLCFNETEMQFARPWKCSTLKQTKAPVLMELCVAKSEGVDFKNST